MGGGLTSGTCLASLATDRRPLVIACEPAGADDAYRSKQAGKQILVDKPDTIADGCKMNLGSNTWPFIRDVVHEVITVSEEEIDAAQRLVFQRLKLVIEPSAALVPAVLLYSERFRELAKERGFTKVAGILSGGNMDLPPLTKVSRDRKLSKL